MIISEVLSFPLLQSINKYGEGLTSKSRWRWTENYDETVKKVKSEDFAFLSSVGGLQKYLGI